MWMIKHWKLIVGGVAVLSVAGAFWLYGYTQYHKGKKNERAVCEAEKQATIEDRLKIRDEQDKIIRPDTRIYIKRLREQTA